MKSKLFLALASLVSTQILFADQLPQPVPGTSEILRFSQLLPVFEQGIPTSEKILSGSWIRTAQATNSECSPTLKDRTSPTGIDNEDGSIISLDFKLVKVPANETIGQSESSVFAVMLKNLGVKDMNQGPFVVDTKVPQFSQYAYKLDSGEEVQNAGFTYACKQIKSDRNLMICGLNLVGVVETSGDQSCKGTSPGILAVYKKISN